MSRGYIKLVVCLLSIVLCFSGCQQGEAKPGDIPAEQIIISEPYRSLQNAPLYIALSQGFFKQEGLEVIIEIPSDFTQAVEQLDTGQSQFLVCTAEKILHLYQQEKKSYCLVGQLSTSEAYYLIARKEDLGERQKIRGKTILGYRGGELPWILLYYELRQDKLNPFLSYNPIENLAHEEIMAVYEAGTGSYILTEEPLVSKLESEGAGLIIPSLQLENRDLPAHTIIASQNFLQDNPTLGKSFLKAVIAAQLWLDQESPAVIAEELQTFFPDYSEIVLQRATGRYKNTGCWQTTPLTKESWQKMQEIMLQEKELLAIIPLDRFQLQNEGEAENGDDSTLP